MILATPWLQSASMVRYSRNQFCIAFADWRGDECRRTCREAGVQQCIDLNLWISRWFIYSEPWLVRHKSRLKRPRRHWKRKQQRSKPRQETQSWLYLVIFDDIGILGLHRCFLTTLQLHCSSLTRYFHYQGNEHYKKKDFDGAIDLYNQVRNHVYHVHIRE